MRTVLVQMSQDEADFVNALLTEVRRAKEKHPSFVSNLSDAGLVITEETGEVCDAMLKYFYEGGDYRDIVKETIEVAATCLRLSEYIAHSTPPPRIMIKKFKNEQPKL